MWMTRASTLAVTPSSSSCRLPASTTSACMAVSERKKSMTPKNSRRSSASRVKLASGSETRGLKQIVSRPLISPPMDGVHDLDGGVAGAGQVVRRDAPDAGDVPARRGVGEAALARQLVALLAVLAAALAVALAGDHDAAGAFPPDVAGGERDGADGFAVLDALGVVLDAAGVQDHGAAGFADPMRRALDGVGRQRRRLRLRAAGPTAWPIRRSSRSRWCALR